MGNGSAVLRAYDGLEIVGDVEGLGYVQIGVGLIVLSSSACKSDVIRSELDIPTIFGRVIDGDVVVEGVLHLLSSIVVIVKLVGYRPDILCGIGRGVDFYLGFAFCVGC